MSQPSVLDSRNLPNLLLRGGPVLILLSFAFVLVAPVYQLMGVLTILGVSMIFIGVVMKAMNSSVGGNISVISYSAAFRSLTPWEIALLVEFAGFAIGWETRAGRNFLILGTGMVITFTIGQVYLEQSQRPLEPIDYLKNTINEFFQQSWPIIVWKSGIIFVFGAYVLGYFQGSMMGAFAVFFIGLVLLAIGGIFQILGDYTAGYTPPQQTPGQTQHLTGSTGTRFRRAPQPGTHRGTRNSGQPGDTQLYPRGTADDSSGRTESNNTDEPVVEVASPASEPAECCPNCESRLARHKTQAYCPECGRQL